MTALFSPGQVVATEGAAKIPQMVLTVALIRHLSGDWGDLSEDDKRLNDEAVRDGTKFWVITESDRSATTFLLPDEY